MQTNIHFEVLIVFMRLYSNLNYYGDKYLLISLFAHFKHTVKIYYHGMYT